MRYSCSDRRAHEHHLESNVAGSSRTRTAHSQASDSTTAQNSFQRVVFELTDSDLDDDVLHLASPRKPCAPRRINVLHEDSDSSTPEATPPPTQTPRRKRIATGRTPSKKAIKAAEQARRETYAQKLFHELNTTVFRGGLPESTALTWNTRLLTTAGRASFKK